MARVLDSEYGTKYPHFQKREFTCKHCGSIGDGMDSELLDTLEALRSRLNAKSINIYSGYRCPTHDKNVGGSGSGPHTGGYAVDMYALDQNGKKIPSSTIALTLEDMGHQKGIGYRCGGGSDASGQTHIDTKNRKWFGDESVTMNKSCCSSFYDYFGIKKQEPVIETPTEQKSEPVVQNSQEEELKKQIVELQDKIKMQEETIFGLRQELNEYETLKKFTIKQNGYYKMSLKKGQTLYIR